MAETRRLNRKQWTRVNEANKADYTPNQAIKLERVLFINPQNPPSASPVMDDLTKLLTTAWSRNKKSKYVFKGTHHCSCHVGSTNTDHFIGPNNDILTNSLCLHYLQFHRDEISQAELDKVRTLLTPAEG